MTHETQTKILGLLVSAIIAVCGWGIQRQLAVNEALDLRLDRMEQQQNNFSSRMHDELSVIESQQDANTQRLLDHMRAARREDAALKAEQNATAVMAERSMIKVDAVAADAPMPVRPQ